MKLNEQLLLLLLLFTTRVGSGRGDEWQRDAKIVFLSRAASEDAQTEIVLDVSVVGTHGRRNPSRVAIVHIALTFHTNRKQRPDRAASISRYLRSEFCSREFIQDEDRCVTFTHFVIMQRMYIRTDADFYLFYYHHLRSHDCARCCRARSQAAFVTARDFQTLRFSGVREIFERITLESFDFFYLPPRRRSRGPITISFLNDRSYTNDIIELTSRPALVVFSLIVSNLPDVSQRMRGLWLSHSYFLSRPLTLKTSERYRSTCLSPLPIFDLIISLARYPDRLVYFFPPYTPEE